MLITHASLITWEDPNRILDDHALFIEGGLIAAIGPSTEMQRAYPGVERLDARGQYVMPGSICAHTHFYGAFSRGMNIPGTAPKDFPEILSKLWWPLDKALTLEDVRYSALVCLIDAIRHGTTTLIDHHASPNAIDGSLDVIAEAVEQAGLRAVLCYEVTDRNGEAGAKAGIAENLRFIKKLSGNSDQLSTMTVTTDAIYNQQSTIYNPPSTIQATFGLHASLTLSDATLDACRAAAPERTGFHIHAAESDADQWDSLAKSGLRVVDRLQKHGILGPHSILAHAVHTDAKEIEILADSGTWVTHQPRSNMNNAVGVAPVESMLRAGVKVCLGNDGFSNAMWEEWKAAYLVHKLWHRDPRRMSGLDVVRMAGYNNAALATALFPQTSVGILKPGAAADLIFVDYHPPTPLSPGNLPWHILFGFHESMVTTTMVAGKVLMKDRQLLTLDENTIAARAREIAAQVWRRYAESG
jgi:putative selenium metabolism protein SsnA